jgi:hypothetical protein
MGEMKDHDSIRSFIATVANLESLPSSVRGDLKDTVDVMNSIGEFAGVNPEGEFAGLGAGAGLTNFLWLGSGYRAVFGSEADKAEATANRSFVESLNLKVQQWASGAALTEEQTKQVAKITPKKGDRDVVIQRKLNQLYNYMNDINESALLRAGIDVRIPEVDLWEAQNLIDKASAEQLQELNDAALINNTSTQAVR